MSISRVRSMVTSSIMASIPSAMVMPLVASLSLSSACKSTSMLISFVNATTSGSFVLPGKMRRLNSFCVLGKAASGIRSKGVIATAAVPPSPS